MRRKYDIRNKRSFVIILILSIAVICVFSLFIYKYNKSSKIMYLVETGSVVQDTQKNFINIEEDATLRVRWNDNYYLIYQDKKINLGKKVIVYNSITGGMKLYGSFYEIQDDGKIVDNKDETILPNTTDTKFYKIDDREYLLVDRTIVNGERNIEALNYVLVELDKMGNAKLSNNTLNLKTITPTVLVTSKYRFDINNEILNFGSYDIDLKKIIGTTNQYKPEDTPDEDLEGEGGAGGGAGGAGSGDGTGAGGDGTGTGDGNGELGGAGSGDIINNGEDGDLTDMEEIKDKSKMTSIVRVVEGLTQIDIDYVIYDPYNEYKAVYAEIIKNGEIEVVHLSKNDTHLLIDNLAANTEYKVSFIYTTADLETGEVVPYTFDEMTLKTKMPEYSISVYKISNVYKTLSYKVNLQSGYSVNSVNVNLSFDYKETDPETGEVINKSASLDSVALVSSDDKYVQNTIDISGYNIEKDTLLKLTVVSVENEYAKLDINSSYTFRFGR